jgi:hypothetical protein
MQTTQMDGNLRWDKCTSMDLDMVISIWESIISGAKKSMRSVAVARRLTNLNFLIALAG